jgi:hypothetical protein
LREILDRRECSHVARFLFQISGVAELAMCGVARVVCSHSGGAIFVSALCEMEREFVVEVAIELFAAKQRLDVQAKRTKPV